MHWRDLLARLRPAPEPLPELVRASADRHGVVDRRAFLSLCVAAVAGLAMDPEALIWTPGERVSVEIYDQLDIDLDWGIESDWFIREGMRILNQNLKFASSVYDPAFIAATTDAVVENGNGVLVRVPKRFSVAAL